MKPNQFMMCVINFEGTKRPQQININKQNEAKQFISLDIYQTVNTLTIVCL